jgi:hypothetical protein
VYHVYEILASSITSSAFVTNVRIVPKLLRHESVWVRSSVIEYLTEFKNVSNKIQFILNYLRFGTRRLLYILCSSICK